MKPARLKRLYYNQTRHEGERVFLIDFAVPDEDALSAPPGIVRIGLTREEIKKLRDRLDRLTQFLEVR